MAIRALTTSEAVTLAPSDNRQQTDAELVLAAVEGDQDALNGLIARYAGLVWSIAASFRFSQADCSDITQLTWLRLCSSLEELREPAQIKFWLCTTTRRECIALTRRRGRTIPVGDHRLLDRLNLDDQPDQIVVKAEGDPKMRQAFSKLGEPCRRLLSMLVGEGTQELCNSGGIIRHKCECDRAQTPPLSRSTAPAVHPRPH